MDTIHIRGGNPLFGETRIQGSKNAVLPIMAASLLIEGTSQIENCPKIADVYHMQKLLESLGCRLSWQNRSLQIDAGHLIQTSIEGVAATGMRSSIMLLGAMLGRLGEAVMAYPGGCVIGDRPIDIHLFALDRMGMTTRQEETLFFAKADKLKGAVIVLPFPSVGATENVILAAVKACGVTVLKNAAREPEITALCQFLQSAGAVIEGIGGDTLLIRGSARLTAASYRVPADRIVAGTYVLSVLGTGGHIFLQDAPAQHMGAVLELTRKLGAEVHTEDSGVVIMTERIRQPLPYLKTQVYPGFPTDLQSPLLTVLSGAQGESVIEESIFENRFRISSQLQKMGACITLEKDAEGRIKYARIKGVPRLKGCSLQAEELRGGAALVAAGCMAEGETDITGCEYIQRGYEDICRDYQNLGVQITNR